MRLLANIISPGGIKGVLSILMYHSVLKESDPFRAGDLDTNTFEWHMKLIAEKFNVLNLDEAVERLLKKSLPPRALCVTFDDGYADNFENALPILKKWNIPATFFITTSYIDGGCMWNDVIIESIKAYKCSKLDLLNLGLKEYSLATLQDRVAAVDDILQKVKHLPQTQRNDSVRYISETTQTPIPTHLMMQSHQIKKLKEEGMCIGGHTATHPILATLDYSSAYKEIEAGIEQLEGLLGEKIHYFAYPNGKPVKDYSSEHIAILKKMNIKAAVSTAKGVSSSSSDIYQLPRFTPWDNVPSRYYLKLLLNCRSKNQERV